MPREGRWKHRWRAVLGDETGRLGALPAGEDLGKGMQHRLKVCIRRLGGLGAVLFVLFLLLARGGVCIFHSQRKELRSPCCYKADIII